MIIEPILKKADEEGLVIYLENIDPKNRPFYENFGFKIEKTGSIINKKNELEYDIMVRQPKEINKE